MNRKFTVNFYHYNQYLNGGDLEKWNKTDLTIDEAIDYVKNNLQEVESVYGYYVNDDNSFVCDGKSWFITDFSRGKDEPFVNDEVLQDFLNYQE